MRPRLPRFPGRIGAVAQLGERRVRNAEVRGSIPLGSTSVQASECEGLRRLWVMCAIIRVVLETISGFWIGVVRAVAKTIGATEVARFLRRREIALPAA